MSALEALATTGSRSRTKKGWRDAPTSIHRHLTTPKTLVHRHAILPLVSAPLQAASAWMPAGWASARLSPPACLHPRGQRATSAGARPSQLDCTSTPPGADTATRSQKRYFVKQFIQFFGFFLTSLKHTSVNHLKTFRNIFERLSWLVPRV